jgi:uncharacterized protein YwgA
MTAFEFVLLLFSVVPGQRIEGRTKLQKVAYFFGSHLGVEGILGYRPHYYGPYSSEVADAVSMLASLGFLGETVSPGTLDAKGFERRKYVYELTTEGKEAVAVISKHVDPDFVSRFQNAVEKLTAVTDADYLPLSYAAKVLWVTRGRPDPTPDQVHESAKSKGWELNEVQILEAFDFLKGLSSQGFNAVVSVHA